MEEPFGRLAEDPISARGYVRHEGGLWVVYVEVLYLTELVTRRIGAYPTQRLAETAAKWMGWNANRDLGSPPTGSL
jgi:hypothetical protein